MNSAPLEITPVTLEGKHVRLEPLTLNHLDSLCAFGLDEDLWRWSPVPIRTREELRAYVETALKEQAAGVSLPFATIDRASNRAAGSTRFGSIDKINHRVEIGWTWVGRELDSG